MTDDRKVVIELLLDIIGEGDEPDATTAKLAIDMLKSDGWNEAVQAAARIAETLVVTRNVTPQGHVTHLRRGATGQEIADEIRRQLLRKVEL